jgi:anti-sigma B factor antagonist
LLPKQEGAPMVTMELHAGECDRPTVVALRGELDVAEATSVSAALTTIAGGDRAVIVDLAGLEFIDSSGIAALVLVRAQARRAGGDLLLAAPRDQVTRVLTLTRLIDVFSVHASVGQAHLAGIATT